MKRLFLLSITLGFLFLVSQSTLAQAFQKGDINLGFGLGLGANETDQSITRVGAGKTPGIPYYWIEAEAASPTSLFLSVSFEYGLLNRIGLALEGKLAATGLSFGKKINHQDLKLKLNYHLFNFSSNDLFFGIAFGMSHLKWEESSTGWYYGGTGTSPLMELSISDRLFIDERNAISINVFYTKYWYEQLAPYSALVTAPVDFQFNMGTVGVQLGYVFKGKR